MSKNILELVLEALDRYVEIEHKGNIQQAGKALGVPNATFYMWIERDRTSSLKAVAPILDSLGYTLARQVEKQPNDVSALEKENLHLKTQNDLLEKTKKRKPQEKPLRAFRRRHAPKKRPNTRRLTFLCARQGKA